tara:strand:+ start:38445 stop:38933 length:489 start_codon:yes stop_codon:yes gene_type:complete
MTVGPSVLVPKSIGVGTWQKSCGARAPRARASAFGRVRDPAGVAFANAGVALPEFRGEVFTHPVFLGVGLGLLLGKPLGVLGAAAIVLALDWAKLPKRVGLGHLVAASVLASIGFTMSLFIGGLAFESEPRDFAVPIRLAVLGANLIATCLGLAILRWRSDR